MPNMPIRRQSMNSWNNVKRIQIYFSPMDCMFENALVLGTQSFGAEGGVHQQEFGQPPRVSSLATRESPRTSAIISLTLRLRLGVCSKHHLWDHCNRCFRWGWNSSRTHCYDGYIGQCILPREGRRLRMMG